MNDPTYESSSSRRNRIEKERVYSDDDKYNEQQEEQKIRSHPPPAAAVVRRYDGAIVSKCLNRVVIHVTLLLPLSFLLLFTVRHH